MQGCLQTAWLQSSWYHMIIHDSKYVKTSTSNAGSTSVSYVSYYYTGRGTGGIFLADVFCTGTEQFLLNCTNRIKPPHTCTHSQDAGVICKSKLHVYPIPIA